MAPLVLDSPHSGHDFPADFGAIVTEAELRESEDCYVDELYAAAHELGVPLLAATFPRTYLDPNRNAGDIDLDLVEGNRKELVGRIQERYGIARDEAERQVSDWERNL